MFYSCQNFIVSILDAEFSADMTLADGTASKIGTLTNRLNLFFTLVFTIELLINAYANWYHHLFRNGYVLSHLAVATPILAKQDPTRINSSHNRCACKRARQRRAQGRADFAPAVARSRQSLIFPIFPIFPILEPFSRAQSDPCFVAVAARLS
jgi:hypothetical protein